MKPINLHEYEALAHECMTPAGWDFYYGGSDDEVTLRANRAAFEHIRLRPRVLVNTDTVDIATTVLGTPVSMPILIAPTACHCLAHPEGECATARGAGAAQTLMIASTTATRSIEEIAQVATGPLWFQLYVYKGMQISEQLVRRAEAAGYRAIVLTVDLPRLGKRERDLHHQFSIPPAPYKDANFVDDTVFEEKNPLRQPHVNMLTWDAIPWLRSITSLPIILKGILTAEDALLAVEQKVDGIVVSNHGGRQLDGALAGIEALPEVIEAVNGRCEVYMDGGIRRGTDVLKALALGARAVLVGRPILWGLAVNGQEGVYDVLELLRAELALALALAGQPNLASINRSLVKIMNY